MSKESLEQEEQQGELSPREKRTKDFNLSVQHYSENQRYYISRLSNASQVIRSVYKKHVVSSLVPFGEVITNIPELRFARVPQNWRIISVDSRFLMLESVEESTHSVYSVSLNAFVHASDRDVAKRTRELFTRFVSLYVDSKISDINRSYHSGLYRSSINALERQKIAIQEKIDHIENTITQERRNLIHAREKLSKINKRRKHKF